MGDVVTWVGDILATNIATIGTVTVTPGFILASTLIWGLAVGAARRLKSLR